MTHKQMMQRSREIALEKAILVRDQAARLYGRNVQMTARMPGSVSTEDVENSKTALDLCELDVELAKLRAQVEE